MQKEGEALAFVWADSNRTRGNGFKPLKVDGFRLGVRKKPFTQRVLKHRLHGKVVDASSLSVFRAGLDGLLSNLI